MVVIQLQPKRVNGQGLRRNGCHARDISEHRLFCVWYVVEFFGMLAKWTEVAWIKFIARGIRAH